MFLPLYNYKAYRLAFTLSNPASAMLKYGGGVEYIRYGGIPTSYMVSYYKYTGAYFGTQYNAEYRFYARRVYEHRVNSWRYRGFFYVRSIVGSAGYDGQGFAILGQKEDKFAPEHAYGGGAVGIGRKYWKGNFFMNVRGGVKYVIIPGLDPIDRSLYRLFYVTGPGSIFEVNFQFGVQL